MRIPADPDEARSDKDTFPPTGSIAGIPGSGAEFPAWYIHHCHILEHEDDDLMRPWTIVKDGD